MYYPPYYPYQEPNMYNVTREAKRDLRRTSNRLCWTLLIALFLMSSFLAFGRLYLSQVGYTADNTNSDFYGYTPILFYLVNGVGYLIGLAAPVLLYFGIRKIDLDDALPFGKVGFVKAMACVFFGSAVCMLANIPANIVVNIEKAFGFSGNMPNMPLADDPWVLVLYFVTIAIIPPIVEELMFRGMILHGLRKFGDGFAIVGSALLFGLYHGNFVQMVFAFIAGLVMALLVVRTGSLWISIAIHFTNNAISYALEMTQRYAGDDVANQVNYVVIGVLVVLGAISLIYLLNKEKHFFRFPAQNPMFRLSTRLGALFFNPGGVAMLIFAVYASVQILTNY